MMIVAAARALEGQRVCFVGVGLPNIAVNLAQRTVAPELEMVYEAGVFGARPSRLPLSIGDPTIVTGSTAVVSMFELFGYYLQGGLIDVGFLGAAQIDRFGNINTTVIGPYDAPDDAPARVSGGACEIAINAREVFVIMRQSRRSFVETIDFRTSPGNLGGAEQAERIRREGGWLGRGPTVVVTDLGIYHFDETGEMRLDSLHPGATVEAVRETIGWDIKVAPDLADHAATDAPRSCGWSARSSTRRASTRSRGAAGSDARGSGPRARDRADERHLRRPAGGQAGQRRQDLDGGRAVLDDQRRDHPEHPVHPLGVGEDVAVEGPDARVLAVDDDVPALARIDAERVACERRATERVAVTGDDPHRLPVEMPRMHHHALVHEADEDLVAELRPRSGTVAGKPRPLIVKPPSVSLLIQTMSWVAPYRFGRAVGGIRGLDDERAEQAAADLVGRVVVRVVHVRPGRPGDELVGVGRARARSAPG